MNYLKENTRKCLDKPSMFRISTMQYSMLVFTTCFFWLCIQWDANYLVVALIGLEKDFLEMLLYYNVLFNIAFDIRNVDITMKANQSLVFRDTQNGWSN